MKINSVKFITSAVRRSQYPEDFKPEFLLVGRSNVGKSSFINTLINRKNMARISAIPGKTQTLNFYLINDIFYFVDVPGYGFARVSKKLKNKFGMIIEDYLKMRENLKMVFMLVDFRHKPTEDDILMYNYLKYYNIPVTVIATKCDKVSKNSYDKNKKMVFDSLKMRDSDRLEIFSSTKKIGKKEVFEILESILN
ncbi:MAG: YihA family ribosome biogenesis GTP-binding protein [Bacilli bacterium]|nr:YihA family ribosome biogenesis GTP-binding protein [Bacilli bacterium]